MPALLEAYAEVAGTDIIGHLQQLAATLRGITVVHVNSTRVGGGVAEILEKLVPLMRELGIDARWEVLAGEGEFYECTKGFHNALQGNRVVIPAHLLQAYERINERNAEQLRPILEPADVVFIHDPQPAPLLRLCPDRKGKWVWRCHIDISRPDRRVWQYLRRFVADYDASIFSLASFAQALPHPEYLIPPSIDPLSDKNRELGYRRDRRRLRPIRTGSPAAADSAGFPLRPFQGPGRRDPRLPACQAVRSRAAARAGRRHRHGRPGGRGCLPRSPGGGRGDPDIHLLLLPPDAHRTINALQRAADIVLQKSQREGFGLTVTEALWKGKPVVAGDTGGIRLQVIDHHTGFLVSTPEGAALRIRYLLHRPERLRQMGEKGQAFVRENFLLTRQVREYLTVMVALAHGAKDRIDLG